MKSLTYKAVAVAAFSVFTINSAMASNAELTVTGEIIATTCKIETQDTATKTIVLPQVPASALASAGQVAPGVRTATFALTGCEGESVNISFDNPEDFTGSHLKNIATAEGSKQAATNVAIKLSKDGQLIDLATKSMSLPLVSGAGNLVIGAEYYALGQSTVGLVKGQLKMTIGHK